MKDSNVNKQELSEARRRQSIKERKQEKCSKTKQISEILRNADSNSKSSRVIKFNDDGDSVEISQSSCLPVSSKPAKMVLFESGSEDDVEDDNDRFQIKPQFEGERGRQLFEMSSSISDERFKLDERFQIAEDFEPLDSGSETNQGYIDHEDEMSLKEEKGKNLAILEQVLGFKMPQKPPEDEISKKKKKYIRFDPESEKASEYIIKQEEEKPNEIEPKKKKLEIPQEPEPLPIVSKEKFYNVSSELKEVLHSSEPFLFGHKFNFSHEDDVTDTNDDMKTEPAILKKNPISPLKEESTKYDEIRESQEDSSIQNHQRMKFFLQPNDPRLKEGVEFFHRSKPVEEIKKQWMESRKDVVNMLKKNKRVAKKVKATSKSLQRQKYGKKFTKKKFNKRSNSSIKVIA